MSSSAVAPLLCVDDLVVEYGSRGRRFAAVADVSFEVHTAETLGLVGESGCGKSTIGRAVIQLPRPTAGRVRFDGHDLTALSRRQMRRLRRSLQIIFQDPIASLNPRRKVRDIVAEPLVIAGIADRGDIERRVRTILDAVGLDPALVLDRRPHQFSGGQCQRICIARALITEPKLIVCDEPVASLDVSIQAQILNLLEDMKQRFGLTLLFISHDLSVVKNVSDRIAVMYLGRFCEIATSTELFRSPAHPYTRALISAIPSIADGVAGRDPPPALTGEIPSPVDPPSGCRFRTRCPQARSRCAEQAPQLRVIAPHHQVACHFPSTE
ncbi:MAG: ATP-binding cassette domain-containing protein [Hyphomicrobiales bacterium]|nr:ATP-binding cassette domain-containing protein [Hyphomicrobiales bacterium]